jgi:hypothetical protein
MVLNVSAQAYFITLERVCNELFCILCTMYAVSIYIPNQLIAFALFSSCFWTWPSARLVLHFLRASSFSDALFVLQSLYHEDAAIVKVRYALIQ